MRPNPSSRWALLAISLLSMPCFLWAQPSGFFGAPVSRTYTGKEIGGPSYSQVWSIVRDGRGLLYLGSTNTALHQYDGAAWRQIPTPSNVTRVLRRDAKGQVWVGMRDEFGYLEPDLAGTLRYKSLMDRVPQEHRVFGDVTEVIPTQDGFWVSAPLRLFHWDGNRMRVWESTLEQAFYSVLLSGGRVLVGRTGMGLLEVVGDSLQPVPGSDLLERAGRFRMLELSEGQVLLYTLSSGLFRFDGEEIRPFPTGADEYFKANPAYTAAVFPDGRFCVGTLSGGAVILTPDGALERILDQSSGLLETGILSSYADQDGALWLGQGVSLARVNMNVPVSVLSPLPHFVSAVHWKGSFYALAATGGLGVYRAVRDPRTGAQGLQPLEGMPDQSFYPLLFRDPTGKGQDQLLLGTNEGPLRIEGDEGIPILPDLPVRRTPFLMIQSRRHPHRVFLAESTGASSMRWEGGGWIDEGSVDELRSSISWIVEDNDGAVWVATQGRVHRFPDPAQGLRGARMETFSREHGVPEGPAGTIRYIGGQILLIPADSSVHRRWDEAARQFVEDGRFYLSLKSARLNEVDLWEDPQGNVWSKSQAPDDFRLGVFWRNTDGSYRLDEDYTRPLAAFHVYSLQFEEDGAILLIGSDGILRFDRQVEVPTPRPYPALVRNIETFAGEVVYGGDVWPNALPPRLRPDQDSLRVEFGAPVFGNELDTVFQCRLEGAEKDWRPWSKQREASYTNLGPGDYTFRVRARSLSGQMGEEGSFTFTILPAWYQSKVAYGAYVLLFLLAGVGARRMVVGRERRKAQREREELELQARALEFTVAERTREIQRAYETVEQLSAIGREITASLDLDTILFKLYERVNQLVDAGVFGVGLYRPEKQQIEYTMAIENGKRYEPFTRDTRNKDQFSVWCLEHRRPVLLNDVEKEFNRYIASYEHKYLTLEDGTQSEPPLSMIYLPLVAQDRVLGIITVQSFRRQAYTERDVSLLENLAAYTSVALDNAAAYQTVQEREEEVAERAAELATINRISQAISAKLEMQSVIQLVGEQIRDLFQAPIAYVALLDRPSMMIHFPYAHGEDMSSQPLGRGLTSQIIRTGQPLLINRNIAESSARLGVERVGVPAASYLGVPIPAGGEIIGVLSVQSTDEENRFTEDDERLLTTIASAVGVAIHNSRLFEEARLARLAAEEADAAKSSFLSTVSHELRTPLTSVLGFAKIIRRRLEDRLFPLIVSEDRKTDQAKRQVLENLEVVLSEGERLTKLINDVLDLAKIEAGKFTWNMEPLKLQEVIEHALSASTSLFEAKSLQLVRNIAPELPEVTGDRDRLIQVILNLLSNAVKFTPAGTVAVSASAREGEVVISVADSGIGIAAADHEKVFDKFKQVGDTLTDKPTGSGLGLPICREIVEHHGGRIWLESEPGKGSVFFFTLPAGTTALRAEHPLSLEALVRQLREKVAGHEPRSRSILVVDDDANIRSLLDQEFTQAGYSVRQASDGREALRCVREEMPGLIVLDVMMPEMSGFDVAAVLKNDPATMDIPIIILSIVEDKERGFRIGVDRYLTKPIDTAALFREVDTLLDQGKSRKKVMIVDQDASTVRTLSEVLEAGGYQVVDSDGVELVKRAVASQPDIIMLNSMFSSRGEALHALRFEKGLENVLFLIYQS